MVLAALLNLSTLRSNQPKMARRGLQVLLKSNTSLYQIIGSRVSCLLQCRRRSVTGLSYWHEHQFVIHGWHCCRAIAAMHCLICSIVF